MSKGLMIRWCGMRLDGLHMTTAGVPFKGKVELRGVRELRCVLVVSEREWDELTRQRMWLEVELNFEARDMQVMYGEGWRRVDGWEVGGLVEADHIECDWPGCPVHVYVDDIHEDPRTVAERRNTRVNKGGAR